MGCINCGKTKGEFFKTAYGDTLCAECWDNYINTDNGRLEYLIGICYGDLPIEEFDAEFLGTVAISYMTHYDLLDLTEEQRLELEKKAKELGLL